MISASISTTIFSMTGFASAEKKFAALGISVELRSVNQRFLELHFKLDDALKSLEPTFRALFQGSLNRGKVECKINLNHAAVSTQNLSINPIILKQISDMAVSLQAQYPNSAAMSIAEIMRWPGVVTDTVNTESENDAETTLANATLVFEACLADLIIARQREGTKLSSVILARLSDIQQIVAKVKPLLPQQISAYQNKLIAKFKEVMDAADDDRIRQEVLLFAQKIDVDEELVRLDAHLQEVQHILKVGGIVGKKLDFLMQELNREANTLGSKSVSIEVSQAAIAIKVLIEQMREQIQNLE